MKLRALKIILLFLLLSAGLVPLRAQEKVFHSLDEARKHPRKVHVLDLSRQHLTAFPADIGRFKNLHTLLLDHNDIRILPKEIARCKKLKVFSMSDNQLERIPESISSMKQLVSLNLEDNLVQSFPADLHKLSQLEKLNIRYNLCDSLAFDPALFPALRELCVDKVYYIANEQKLQSLLAKQLNFITAGEIEYDNARYRSASVLNPAGVFEYRSACSKKYQNDRRYFFLDMNEALRKAPRVRALDLRERGLSAVPVEITRFCNLEELYIGNGIKSHVNGQWSNSSLVDSLPYLTNRIDSLSEAFFSLKHIQVIDLSGLTGISLDSRIVRFSELRELYLSKSGVNSFPPNFSQLKKLEILFCDHLKTSAFDNKPMPDVICQLHQLVVLHIGFNNWTIDPEAFSGFKSLRELNMYSLPVSDAQIEKLRKILSRTDIYAD